MSHKRPEKYREITIEPMVWNTYVSVMIGGEKRQRRALLDRCKVPERERDHFLNRMAECAGAQCLYTEYTPGNVFVYFPRRPNRDDANDLGAVTHEMLHAAVAILRRKGVTLSHDSEEAFAYLTEFLVREFWTSHKQSDASR